MHISKRWKKKMFILSLTNVVHFEIQLLDSLNKSGVPMRTVPNVLN